MQSSSITKILKNFPKEEIKEFGKFVNSPYFNTSKATILLFEELKKHYPLFDKKNYTRENLFSAVYGSRAFRDDLLRKLISNLIILTEEFIFINNIRRDKALKKITILDNINQYGEGSQIESKLNDLEETIQERKIYSGHLKDMASLNRIKYNFCVNNNMFKEASENLNGYGDYTLSHFLQSFADIYKLKSQVLSSYKKEKGNTAFDIFFRYFDLEGFSAEKEIQKNTDYFSLRESYLFIKLNSSLDDFPAYNELRAQLYDNINLYDHAYACRVITALLNFRLSRVIHKKDQKSYKELFSLYKFSLEHGNLLSFHNKFMNLVTYRNILYIAIEVKEFEWIRTFITDYLPFVKADNKDSLENISLGILSFEISDFPKTLEYIMKVKYDHEIFKIDVKNILMKTYYELGYYETAISVVDATKHLLSGGINISEGVRKLHLTFIKYYTELLNTRLNYDEYRKHKLIKDLEADESVLSRQWLVDKAKELNQT
jgi:predicted small secreted protein